MRQKRPAAGTRTSSRRSSMGKMNDMFTKQRDKDRTSTGTILMIDIIDSKYVLSLKHTKPIPRTKHQKSGET